VLQGKGHGRQVIHERQYYAVKRDQRLKKGMDFHIVHGFVDGKGCRSVAFPGKAIFRQVCTSGRFMEKERFYEVTI
jgi:hypothetical protein